MKFVRLATVLPPGADTVVLKPSSRHFPPCSIGLEMRSTSTKTCPDCSAPGEDVKWTSADFSDRRDGYPERSSSGSKRRKTDVTAKSSAFPCSPASCRHASLK